MASDHEVPAARPGLTGGGPSGPPRRPRSGGSAATRSATRPCPGSSAPGSRAAHGTSTKARSCARGWGRVSAGSSETHRRAVVAGHRDDVDVERARTPAHLPGAPGRLLELVRPRQPAGRVARAADHATALRYGGCSTGPHGGVSYSVERADQAVVRERGQRGAERAGPVAQVGAQRQDGAGHARARRIVTATSSKGTPRSASGLCTVISTASTSGSARQVSASRCARVSSRSTGSPVEHRVQLLGQRGVVDRPARSSPGGGRRGVQLQDGVDAEGLAALALPVVDPVVGVRAEAADGDPVGGRVGAGQPRALLRSATQDEAHRLGPGGRVVAEQAADGRGDGGRARLAHAAHRHAQVLGLDDHDDAARLQHVLSASAICVVSRSCTCGRRA